MKHLKFMDIKHINYISCLIYFHKTDVEGFIIKIKNEFSVHKFNRYAFVVLKSEYKNRPLKSEIY